MNRLSSRQTFLTKYVITAVWAIGPIVIAIVVYNKFGQVDGFYMAPIGLLPAVMSYLPMKISYDKTKIIVSDLFTNQEFKLSDIKLLEYTRPTISFHPYRQLELTTNDNRVKKVKFIPRSADAIKSFFSRGLKGRQKELIELWTEAHNRQQ